ncbi:P-loop containing nucleoside triphosphate hydrolase protein [Dactylonectria estremocensis]|uniref:DNA 3'-5' helicase n=1 Tax=Dactylonectria estremocensis TaxID=1079267 RepID=A0A9P9ET08_9HYPO|nr:P-loop containing nucleoside triphosphate hydrolase protein [Dactylonectria estremocensis]
MNKSPIVVVMGTGTGKSLCFMLPAASCPGGVTVVVVPLVSLQGDMLDRCRKLNISCAEWRSDRVPGNVSIVFTTPESAMMKRFQDYIESLRVTARLDRFVIDEGHTILEGTRTFRPTLRELGGLALIGVQMVYLTATLPPTREDALFSLINTRREDVVMIQMRITRTNVAYSVRSISSASAGEATAAVTLATREIVNQKLEEYPWPAKIIIYCQRVEATEALAEEFGCDAYYREMSGLRRDQYGDGRVIVATNALGLGIDVPDIRVVLHIEMPFEMADYAQQSGRAGRDGLRSEAIIVRVDIKADEHAAVWLWTRLWMDGETGIDVKKGKSYVISARLESKPLT